MMVAKTTKCEIWSKLLGEMNQHIRYVIPFKIDHPHENVFGQNNELKK